MNKNDLIKEILSVLGLKSKWLFIAPFVANLSETEIKEKAQKIKETIEKWQKQTK